MAARKKTLMKAKKKPRGSTTTTKTKKKSSQRSQGGRQMRPSSRQRQPRSQRRRQTRNQSARKKERATGWPEASKASAMRGRDRVDDKFEFCDFGQQANLLEHNGPMLGLGSREDFSTAGGGRFWQGSRLSLALSRISRILRIDARASVQLRSVKVETSFVIELRRVNYCLDTIPPTICCLAATVTTTMTTSTTWSIIVATLLV